MPLRLMPVRLVGPTCLTLRRLAAALLNRAANALRHLIPPIFSLPALKLHSPPTFDRLDLNDSSFGRGEQTPERPCPSLLSSAKPH